MTTAEGAPAVGPTAGPWDVNHFGGDWRVIARTNPHEVAICTTAAKDGDPIATARLIAAAPELLEALQSVMSLMTECDCTNSDESGPSCPCKLARAAIAKATGAA